MARRLAVVASARRPHLPGVRYDFLTRHPTAEVSHIQELDVSPYRLEDTPRSRGRCGFEALQCPVCGAPPVASLVCLLVGAATVLPAS